MTIRTIFGGWVATTISWLERRKRKRARKGMEVFVLRGMEVLILKSMELALLIPLTKSITFDKSIGYSASLASLNIERYASSHQSSFPIISSQSLSSGSSQFEPGVQFPSPHSNSGPGARTGLIFLGW